MQVIESFLPVAFLLAFLIGALGYLVMAIFSSSVRKQIAAHPFVYTLWFLAALLIIAIALWPVPHVRTGPRVSAWATMRILEVACNVYQAEYGSFPVGDNSAIAKALHGSNPRNIVFLEFKSVVTTNSLEEVIDPWGTPYRFTLQSGQPPVIRSAGPDRAFDSKDDFAVPSP